MRKVAVSILIAWLLLMSASIVYCQPSQNEIDNLHQIHLRLNAAEPGLTNSMNSFNTQGPSTTSTYTAKDGKKYQLTTYNNNGNTLYVAYEVKPNGVKTLAYKTFVEGATGMGLVTAYDPNGKVPSKTVADQRNCVTLIKTFNPDGSTTQDLTKDYQKGWSMTTPPTGQETFKENVPLECPHVCSSTGEAEAT